MQAGPWHSASCALSVRPKPTHLEEDILHHAREPSGKRDALDPPALATFFAISRSEVSIATTCRLPQTKNGFAGCSGLRARIQTSQAIAEIAIGGRREAENKKIRSPAETLVDEFAIGRGTRCEHVRGRSASRHSAEYRL